MCDLSLTVTEFPHSHGFFDSDANYTAGHADHVLPAPVPGDVFEEAMRLALLAHRSLGCRGISRSDLRYDDSLLGTDGLFFPELTSQPGFTPVSLVHEQAAHVGVPFADLCEWLMANASCSGCDIGSAH